MAKRASIPPRVPPEAFRQHRQVEFERTVQLTQKAIAQLNAQGRPVTLVVLAEATRAFDVKGKGLAPNTIFATRKRPSFFGSPARRTKAASAGPAELNTPRPRAVGTCARPTKAYGQRISFS
jgi:hypothetical protein